MILGVILNNLVHNSMHRDLENRVQRDLKMQSAICKGLLIVGDYERIEEQIMLWGEEDKHVLSFTVKIGNDIPIVKFSRDIKSNYYKDFIHSSKTTSGRKFDFEMKYDFSQYNTDSLRFVSIFFLFSGCIAIFFIISIWIIIQRVNIHPLQNEISERKRAEKELKSAKNSITNIINSMPSMLVGMDLNGIITQWNHGAEKVTGVSAVDAVGKSLEETVSDLGINMDKIYEVIKNRKEQVEFRRIRFVNDAYCYEDLTIYPLIANEVEGAVLRLDDVTEQVRLEEMMVQSEKMMSVGGLAAGMAHEINNPLAGMIQTAYVVNDRMTNLDLAANKREAEKLGITMNTIRDFMIARGIPKMMNNIRESGTRAAKIVSNMLSFSRKSNSSFSVHKPVELLDQIVSLANTDYDLKKKYDFRKIEIIREYEENLPLILCEPSKIQQVLLNILLNGAEAMQDSLGKYGVKRMYFILRLIHEKENNVLRIEIEDNGPGMDEKTRKRAFEPFFTTKSTNRGTGLGLSVSYFIITETHDGTMTVESNPGIGTKFIIRLPIKDVGLDKKRDSQD